MPSVVTRNSTTGAADYSGGNFTSTAVNTPTPAGAPSGNSNNSGLTGTKIPSNPAPVSPAPNPDAGYSEAESNLTPSATPSEDTFFSDLYAQMAPVIQSINSAESSAETAAYAAGTQEDVDLNASLGTRGLGGSSDAAGERATANLGVAGNIAQAKQAQSSALSSAYQYLTSQAHTEFTDALASNTALSKDYVANAKATVAATIAGVAESGITSATDWQSKDPKGYTAALQYYGGDTTALNSAIVMSQPANKIAQSWVQGSKYYQIVTDPITGKPTVQSVDVGINIPVNWTSNKISTTTLMMQDPNNPANSIIYTTDPISGQVSVSGTGTGAALASQYNSSGTATTGNSGASSDSSASSTASANYITTATSTAGIADPTALFSTAINGDGTNSGVGIGSLIAGINKAEGGSPSGVVNNPGNVKYVAGMAGAVDSGVKATDGGTFASFNTPAAGQAAIASTLNGISSSLGSNATVQDVLDKYANLSTTSSTNSASGTQSAVGTNGLPLSQYGALANVEGFDPGTGTDAQITDSQAYNYLTEYMSGQTPSPSSLGISTRTGSGAQFDKAALRAKTLYNAATGKNLPNQTELTANVGFINANNSILNSLSNQEGTIQSNSDLLQSNITAANINENAPAINQVIDGIQNTFFGDPATASYLAQNSTLSNELGSLMALKNASGTTVHDKLISAELISPNASATQEADVVNTLMKEAQNGRAAITLSNAKLYQQTDPLGLDPQNPLNNPETFAQSVGIDLSGILNDNPGMTAAEVIQQYVNSN